MPSDIKIQIRQTSAATSEAEIRRHRILIDRPASKGGDDQGPMGGELFLASIGGCFMSNLLAAIRAREADVSGVQTEVIGLLADDAPARFSAVELCVSANCSDRELFEKLVEIAERGCIMVNTLRGKLDLTVRIGVPV
jgi:putative redox protein